MLQQIMQAPVQCFSTTIWERNKPHATRQGKEIMTGTSSKIRDFGKKSDGDRPILSLPRYIPQETETLGPLAVLAIADMAKSKCPQPKT